MGSYGFGPRIPPMPGQPAPQYGPRYGAPYQPEGTVGYKTPMANQFVEGVNNFIGSFQGVQEAEKQRARQEFFEGVQMAQLGLKVDMKKLARAARKGELPFDFGGESQPQQQVPQPGQMPPMMGMGPGMQPPPGIMPQGGGMPGGGGVPVPGGGGGRGFFGRLGAAISDPFRAAAERNAPIPGNAGIYGQLQQIQQQAQLKQQLGTLEGQKQLELAKMAVDYLKNPTPEKAARLAEHKLLDLPETVQSIYSIASMVPGTDPQKALTGALDEITGASKASAAHETAVAQTARSLLQYYDGDLEKAKAAAESVMTTDKLPEELRPKIEDKASQRIFDKALELTTRYRGLGLGAAYSIAARALDPIVSEEEKTQQLAALDNFKTYDDDRLAIAQQQVYIALENLKEGKEDTARDKRVRDTLSKIIISNADPMTGKINFAGARTMASGMAALGYGGADKEDVAEIMEYLRRAEGSESFSSLSAVLIGQQVNQNLTGGGNGQFRLPSNVPPPGGAGSMGRTRDSMIPRLF